MQVISDFFIEVDRLWPSRRDGRAMQRDYRASAQKLNWFAAESEVQEVLNRALEDVVQQIAGDLGAVCAGKAAGSTRADCSRSPKELLADIN